MVKLKAIVFKKKKYFKHSLLWYVLLLFLVKPYLLKSTVGVDIAETAKQTHKSPLNSKNPAQHCYGGLWRLVRFYLHFYRHDATMVWLSMAVFACLSLPCCPQIGYRMPQGAWLTDLFKMSEWF